MSRPPLRALGRRPPPPPPVHRCSCGCGGEASFGYPFGRWYVPGHEPATPEPTQAVMPVGPPADMFAAAGVFAPRRRAGP